jgi:hypothetical protein
MEASIKYTLELIEIVTCNQQALPTFVGLFSLTSGAAIIQFMQLTSRDFNQSKRGPYQLIGTGSGGGATARLNYSNTNLWQQHK